MKAFKALFFILFGALSVIYTYLYLDFEPKMIFCAVACGLFALLVAFGLDALFGKMGRTKVKLFVFNIIKSALLSAVFLVVFRVMNKTFFHLREEAVLRAIDFVIVGYTLYFTLSKGTKNQTSIFLPASAKLKRVVIDQTVLEEGKILPLCESGLLDQKLCIPEFLIDDLKLKQDQNESYSHKAEKTLEILETLFAMPKLDLKVMSTYKRSYVEFARSIKADYLTTLPFESQMQKDVRIIDLKKIIDAFKHTVERGDLLQVKVQRIGKEPSQGVGFLNDGTMIVINDGAKLLNEVAQVQVISMTNTHSGKIIFGNVIEDAFQTV